MLVLTLGRARRFNGVVPDSSHASAASGLQKLGQKIDSLVQAYLAAMEKIRLREGIRIAFEITRAGNGFITVRTQHACCCTACPAARAVCWQSRWLKHRFNHGRRKSYGR